jgi:formylglycine-generating enzyme required for sulfatase activity
MSRRVTRVTVLILTLLAGASAAVAQSRDLSVEEMRTERRVALVIGNGAYPMAGLRNPVNDARAVTATLKALRFDVLAYENLNEKDMRRAIDAFGDRLRGSGVGFFYYSGHGLQVRGRNYLVPVDAKLGAEADVEYESVDVGRALAKMESGKNRLNIVVLDACRNNPFEKAWARSAGPGGLAQVTPPTGTFIAYATMPGRVASDGPGTNGLYTSELLKAMREPGLTLEGVFKRAGGAVAQATKRAQEPQFWSSVYGDFMFTLPAAGTKVAAVPPPVEPPRLQGREEIRQEFGTLALSARLADVDVWVGDQKVWTSRPGAAYVLSNVPAGTHRIVAKKPGHREWEREVQVAANQRAEVVIDIEPLRAEPPKVLTTEDGAEMVLVPAGEFTMGSNEYDDEKPPRRVYLDAFHIDKYEVTNAQYRRFVQATNRAAPSWYWNDPKFNGSTQPVVGVSWHDAAAYCGWAGKRLPTEAEWEKAARGTDGRKYPWGEAWDASRANSDDSKLGRTAPVGSYATGASPYGAQGMAGNVWEWVADWYAADYYQRSPERNPKGPESGQYRVVRGGSWVSAPLNLRASGRLNLSTSPDARGYYVGFRCARGLP